MSRLIAMKKGTILIPTGPTKHLHFICSDPVFYPRLVKECVLVVNISSVGSIEHDKSCLLDVDDHPFITHLSYVYYKKSEILGVNSIDRNIASGDFIAHEPCSDIVFERILNGFECSDEVTGKIKKFYDNYCVR